MPRSSLLLHLLFLIFAATAAADELRIRKDQHDLSSAERNAVVTAIWEMKNTPLPDAVPDGPQNIYDAFVEVHREAAHDAHAVPAFLPWHRQFLWDFETELLAAHDRVQSCAAHSVQVDCVAAPSFLTGLPYWNWTTDQATNEAPWTDDFMGGNGAAESIVQTGPFAQSTGWKVWDPDQKNGGEYLRRAFGSTLNGAGLFPTLPTAADESAAMNVTTYDVEPWNNTSPIASSFRNNLEGWHPSGPQMHNRVHVWIDGTMWNAAVSPSDPIFFLHHAQVDRLWWQWQQQNGIGPENYLPESGQSLGQNLNDPLVNLPARSPAAPDAPDVTPADVLDIEGPRLGYLYAPRAVATGQPKDVILALDTSGSMGLKLADGRSRLEAAKEAAQTFLSLVALDAGHRVGLVEFNATAKNVLDPSTLLDVTEPNVATLQSAIDGLKYRGVTSIGAGLQAAQNLFPPAEPGVNAPNILLMTDGLQNHAPAMEEVSLGGTQINAIGFGPEAGIDGAALAKLAQGAGGLYHHAGDGLALTKAFVSIYGEIFKSGVALDPIFAWPENARQAADPFSFHIDSEKELTIVMGWDASSDTKLELISPDGDVIDRTTPGVTVTEGPRWTSLRIPLPFQGDQVGQWQAKGERGVAANPAEAYQAPEESFFLTALVDGGPRLQSLPGPMIYTGDKIAPLVRLQDEDGRPLSATMELDVTRPVFVSHNPLPDTPLVPASQPNGDQLDTRSATLLEWEATHPQATERVTRGMLDDGARADGVAGDGYFGLADTFTATVPGSYTFVARATYGQESSRGNRETSWSSHVEVGIDADATSMLLTTRDSGDGQRVTTVELKPQDALGNWLGLGRAEAFAIVTSDGQSITDVHDQLDGSYTFEIGWDAEEGLPDFEVRQPGRAHEAFYTPGSERGEQMDEVPDLWIDPTTGEMMMDYDGADVLSVTIESKRGLFNGPRDPFWHDGPVPIDSDTMIAYTFSEHHHHEGLDPLGWDLLGTIPAGVSWLDDITVRVVTRESLSHDELHDEHEHLSFVAGMTRELAANVIVIPEPSTALAFPALFLLLLATRSNSRAGFSS